LLPVSGKQNLFLFGKQRLETISLDFLQQHFCWRLAQKIACNFQNKAGSSRHRLKNNQAHFGQETNLKSPILRSNFQTAGSEATLNHSRQFLAARSGKQSLFLSGKKRLETISLDFLQQHFAGGLLT